MVASVAAGLTEAGLLAIVADAAAATVLHSHQVTLTLGLIHPHAGIAMALAIACALALARGGFQAFISWQPARLCADVQANLRRELVDAFSSASWSVQSADLDGHVQELMTGQVEAATQFVVFVANALSALVMFVVLVASALALSVIAALVVLVTSVGMTWILRPITHAGGRASRSLSQAMMGYAEAISEISAVGQEAHVFGVSGKLQEGVGGQIDKVQDVYFRSLLVSRLVPSTYQSIIFLLIVVGVLAVYFINPDGLTSLGAVILMLVRASAYGQQFQAASQAVVQAQPYLDRLEASLERYRSSRLVHGTTPLPQVSILELDRVGFSYVDGVQVLDAISLSINAGEAIGIIGSTGAGKSTLTQILLGLREPKTGEYRVNGRPIQAYDLADWRKRVAYVPQEPRLIHATVTENIRFFRESLKVEDIERAARAANIHEEILELSLGYETVIGQRADGMSGGQRQRICLARALVGRPDVLILDEATSGVDIATEHAIRDSLAHLRRGATLLIVSHRLPLLQICDSVITLVRGSITATTASGGLVDHAALHRALTALTPTSDQGPSVG